MKTYHFLPGLLFLLPLFAAGQRTGGSVSRDTTTTVASRAGSLLTFRQMDQRKVYKWRNGQRSTPSGRQADSRGAKYVRVWGDSAVVVLDPEVYRKEQ